MVNCLGFRIIQPFSSLALLGSNDIPMYIIRKSRHLRKKVRNKTEFEEVRNVNNFPFNHKDSTYREAVIPKINCSAFVNLVEDIYSCKSAYEIFSKDL